MSQSNTCKIKGNKNSWKMSVKKTHKVDKCWLDHYKEIVQNTPLGWAERSSSEAHLPSSNGRMSEKEQERKTTPRDSAAPPLKHFTTITPLAALGWLISFAPAKPSLTSPAQGPSQHHISLCCWASPEQLQLFGFLNYSCPNLFVPELLTLSNPGLSNSLDYFISVA